MAKRPKRFEAEGLPVCRLPPGQGIQRQPHPQLKRVRPPGIDQSGGRAARSRGCGSAPNTAPNSRDWSESPTTRSQCGVRRGATSPCRRSSLAAATGHEAKYDRSRNLQQKLALDLDDGARGTSQKLCYRRSVLRTDRQRDWCFSQRRYRQDQPPRPVTWQERSRATNKRGRADAAASSPHPAVGA